MVADIEKMLSGKGKLINKEIAAVFPKKGIANLNDAVWHAVPGGKRIRPILAIITCEALGGNSKQVLPFAAACEVLHNWLLVHDDIEDLQLLMANGIAEMPNGFQRSLAITYASEVLPDSEASLLAELVSGHMYEPEEINIVIDMLDRIGTGLYLLAEMERLYTSGVNSLQKAGPLPPAGDELLAMIGGLNPDR